MDINNVKIYFSNRDKDYSGYYAIQISHYLWLSNNFDSIERMILVCLSKWDNLFQFLI